MLDIFENPIYYLVKYKIKTLFVEMLMRGVKVSEADIRFIGNHLYVYIMDGNCL
jgi:hypothetical protein